MKDLNRKDCISVYCLNKNLVEVSICSMCVEKNRCQKTTAHLTLLGFQDSIEITAYIKFLSRCEQSVFDSENY